MSRTGYLDVPGTCKWIPTGVTKRIAKYQNLQKLPTLDYLLSKCLGPLSEEMPAVSCYHECLFNACMPV